MNTSRHFNIKVKGRVQGVGFRNATKSKAMQLGVTGFVKNQVDGSVYIEAEASDDTLQQFFDWCHYGPSLSKVISVEIEEGKMNNFQNFTTK